jgi:hypothetical protein
MPPQLPLAPPVLIGFLTAPLDLDCGLAINFDPSALLLLLLVADLFFLSLI